MKYSEHKKGKGYNNWALKPNQPKEPPFIDYMLAICSTAKPLVFKPLKLSSNAERVSQGTKPGDQPRHKKHSTSSKQPSVSSKEETKGGSSKAPIGSKTGHLKKKKDSNLTMESNPIQTSVSTPVVTEMHKEDQQATGGPNSLGVTTPFIIHYESALGYDASANSTAEADPAKSPPSDFIPQQQGLETVLNQSTSNKGASNIAKQIEEVEASSTIKLEDLAKLVQNVQPSFKDLDSPEDDPIIVVDDSDEDEEADKDGLHATLTIETEDVLVPKSLSLRSSEIQELTNQVLILQSQNHKLELEKNKAETEADLLKAQPSFPNVGQLNKLLVKSLQTKSSKILSAHDFSSSLPTELKDLSSKFNELSEEVKGLKKQAKLKTLDALPSLLNKVTNALNQFAQAIASKKTKDTSIPSAGQAGTQPAEGEKNTNQTTISQ
ncbi:hypothetical protein Tco_0072478 [Tanacetum coccineum]